MHTESSHGCGNVDHTNNSELTSKKEEMDLRPTSMKEAMERNERIKNMKVEGAEEVKAPKMGEEELVKREKRGIFEIVTIEGKSAVFLGKYRMSVNTENIDEAREDADRFDLERVMQIMQVFITENNSKNLIQQ